MEAMPPREIGDPAAFRQASEVMFAHGATALAKLPDVGIGRPQRFSSHERMALEAIVIADDSRPSFLLENGYPPTSYPFMGIWESTINLLRTKIQRVALCVGRVQPTNGRFIGTATVIDAAKDLALTNYPPSPLPKRPRRCGR
jgi:serine protease